MDPTVQRILNSIKAVETPGGEPMEGKSGEMYSRYQFLPETWTRMADKYLGDPTADVLENEDTVMERFVTEQLNSGLNPQQIAAIHNSGKPTWTREDGTPKKGVNKWGVAYSVPHYVNKFTDAYNGFLQTEQEQAAAMPQDEAPTDKAQEWERINMPGGGDFYAPKGADNRTIRQYAEAAYEKRGGVAPWVGSGNPLMKIWKHAQSSVPEAADFFAGATGLAAKGLDKLADVTYSQEMKEYVVPKVYSMSKWIDEFADEARLVATEKGVYDSKYQGTWWGSQLLYGLAAFVPEMAMEFGGGLKAFGAVASAIPKVGKAGKLLTWAGELQSAVTGEKLITAATGRIVKGGESAYIGMLRRKTLARLAQGAGDEAAVKAFMNARDYAAQKAFYTWGKATGKSWAMQPSAFMKPASESAYAALHGGGMGAIHGTALHGNDDQIDWGKVAGEAGDWAKYGFLFHWAGKAINAGGEQAKKIVLDRFNKWREKGKHVSWKTAENVHDMNNFTGDEAEVAEKVATTMQDIAANEPGLAADIASAGFGPVEAEVAKRVKQDMKDGEQILKKSGQTVDEVLQYYNTYDPVTGMKWTDIEARMAGRAVGDTNVKPEDVVVKDEAQRKAERILRNFEHGDILSEAEFREFTGMDAERRAYARTRGEMQEAMEVNALVDKFGGTNRSLLQSLASKNLITADMSYGEAKGMVRRLRKYRQNGYADKFSEYLVSKVLGMRGVDLRRVGTEGWNRVREYLNQGVKLIDDFIADPMSNAPEIEVEAKLRSVIFELAHVMDTVTPMQAERINGVIDALEGRINRMKVSVPSDIRERVSELFTERITGKAKKAAPVETPVEAARRPTKPRGFETVDEARTEAEALRASVEDMTEQLSKQEGIVEKYESVNEEVKLAEKEVAKRKEDISQRETEIKFATARIKDLLEQKKTASKEEKAGIVQKIKEYRDALVKAKKQLTVKKGSIKKYEKLVESKKKWQVKYEAAVKEVNRLDPLVKEARGRAIRIEKEIASIEEAKPRKHPIAKAPSGYKQRSVEIEEMLDEVDLRRRQRGEESDYREELTRMVQEGKTAEEHNRVMKRPALYPEKGKSQPSIGGVRIPNKTVADMIYRYLWARDLRETPPDTLVKAIRKWYTEAVTRTPEKYVPDELRKSGWQMTVDDYMKTLDYYADKTLMDRVSATTGVAYEYRTGQQPLPKPKQGEPIMQEKPSKEVLELKNRAKKLGSAALAKEASEIASTMSEAERVSIIARRTMRTARSPIDRAEAAAIYLDTAQAKAELIVQHLNKFGMDILNRLPEIMKQAELRKRPYPTIEERRGIESEEVALERDTMEAMWREGKATYSDVPRSIEEGNRTIKVNVPKVELVDAPKAGSTSAFKWLTDRIGGIIQFKRNLLRGEVIKIVNSDPSLKDIERRLNIVKDTLAQVTDRAATFNEQIDLKVARMRAEAEKAGLKPNQKKIDALLARKNVWGDKAEGLKRELKALDKAIERFPKNKKGEPFEPQTKESTKAMRTLAELQAKRKRAGELLIEMQKKGVSPDNQFYRETIERNKRYTKAIENIKEQLGPVEERPILDLAREEMYMHLEGAPKRVLFRYKEVKTLEDLKRERFRVFKELNENLRQFNRTNEWAKQLKTRIMELTTEYNAALERVTERAESEVRNTEAWKDASEQIQFEIKKAKQSIDKANGDNLTLDRAVRELRGLEKKYGC